MATPHVAGVVALILERNPYLNFYQIYDILMNSVYQPSHGTPYPNNNYGWGIVNALRAIELTPPLVDISMVEILPISMVNSGSTFSVRVKVLNRGTADISNVPLKMEVLRNESLILVRDSIIPSIDWKDTILVDFGTYYAGLQGTYKLRIFHLLSGDINPTNDTIEHFYSCSPNGPRFFLWRYFTPEFPPYGDWEVEFIPLGVHYGSRLPGSSRIVMYGIERNGVLTFTSYNYGPHGPNLIRRMWKLNWTGYADSYDFVFWYGDSDLIDHQGDPIDEDRLKIYRWNDDNSGFADVGFTRRDATDNWVSLENQGEWPFSMVGLGGRKSYRHI